MNPLQACVYRLRLWLVTFLLAGLRHPKTAEDYLTCYPQLVKQVSFVEDHFRTRGFTIQWSVWHSQESYLDNQLVGSVRGSTNPMPHIYHFEEVAEDVLSHRILLRPDFSNAGELP